MKQRCTQGKNPKVTLYITIHFDDVIHFLTLFNKFECILKIYVSKELIPKTKGRFRNKTKSYSNMPKLVTFDDAIN